jgi:hypothetical protein
MKRAFFILAFAAVFLGFVPAQDFGIDVDSSATFLSTANASLSEANKAILWVKLPLGSAFRFDAKGNVSWSGTGTLDSTGPASLLSAYAYTANSFGWDIDLVKFGFAIPNPQADLPSMAFSFGRYSFADQTRLVYSGKADGASIAFNYGIVQFSLDAAYTGFLFKRTTIIELTDTDIAANSSESNLFASPRALVKAELSFPNIFGHSAAVSAFVQEDMRPAASFVQEWETTYVPGSGGPLDTQYLSLKVSGPIFDAIFYELTGAFGAGRVLRYVADDASPTGDSYQYKPILSGLGSATISWYPSFLPGSMIALRGVFASGDAGDGSAGSTNFIPITSTPLGLVFSPKLSNIAFGELTASAQPVPGMKLQTLVKVLSFFRPTTGPVSEPGVHADSISNYLGSELDIYIIYRILSDLGISFTLGAFMPGIDPMGAFDSTYAVPGSIHYSAGLAVSISM